MYAYLIQLELHVSKVSQQAGEVYMLQTAAASILSSKISSCPLSSLAIVFYNFIVLQKQYKRPLALQSHLLGQI